MKDIEEKQDDSLRTGNQRVSMNDFEHEATGDDFELEITDLPGSADMRGMPGMLMTLGSRFSLRSRVGRLATSGTAIMLVLLLILGNFPSAKDQALSVFARLVPSAPGASGSTGDTSTPEIITYTGSSEINLGSAPPLVGEDSSLGLVPKNCAKDTPLQNFVPRAYSPGAGGLPVWVTGFNGPRAFLSRFARAEASQLGWTHQITLVLEMNYGGTITLQGGNLANRFPLWFANFPSIGGLTTSFVIKLDNPIISNRLHWRALPVVLYLQFSGCYYLRATWPEGSWTVYFAAGRR